MIFAGPAGSGLRYDTSIHDFIEDDGTMASAERVAAVWGMSVEEVEEDRRTQAEHLRLSQERNATARANNLAGFLEAVASYVEQEWHERRRLFFATMRRPEMRMVRLALRYLSLECAIDWRSIEWIDVSSGECSGCWGFEFNQYYVYLVLGWVSLAGRHVDIRNFTYEDFSMVDLHWDDLPGCLCYACEKARKVA